MTQQKPTYDDVVRELGEFGKYQKLIYFLLCLPGATHGIRMVLGVFLLYTPNHRCSIPDLDNDTYHPQSPSHAAAINRSVPFNDEGLPDSCLMYIYDTDNVTYDSYNRPINASTTTCDNWVFDTSVMEATATSDFQLVCGQSLRRSHATMVYMFGYLVGVFLLGILSDWLGRKRSLCLAVVSLAASGLGLAATNNFYLFVVVSFFTGASTAAVWTSAFVIGMELVGPSKRVYTGVIINFFFAGGLLALGGVAWAVRDWRYLDLAVTSPVLFYLSYWWLIPESPRWLLQKGRYSELEAVIQKAARVNGVALPPSLMVLTNPKREGEKEGTGDAPGCRDNRKDGGRRRKWVIQEFCSSWRILGRTLVVCFNWFVVSMVYYALSLNVGNLGNGSVHVNFLLSSLVEVPAYALDLFLLDRIGRRRLHCLVMLIAGLGCGATLLPVFLLSQGSEYQWVTVVLALIGKLGAAASFASVYIFSSELFPTVLRNAGMGTASVCARVGGMLAPYVAEGGRMMGGAMGRAFPLMVCGSAAVLAGLLATTLPETAGEDMPDTVHDIKIMGQRKLKADKDQMHEPVTVFIGSQKVTPSRANGVELTSFSPAARLNHPVQYGVY